MFFFARATTESDLIEAQRLRHLVFCEEKGWLPAESLEYQIETDRFDKHSAHYLAYDAEGNPVGSARIIFHTDDVGLQVADHAGPVRYDDFRDCAEISRMVALSGHRQGSILLGLIRMMYVDLLYEYDHLRYVYLVIAPKMYSALNRLGFNYEQIGEPEPWHGHKMVAARASVAEMEACVREVNPYFSRWLHERPEQMDSSISMVSFA